MGGVLGGVLGSVLGGVLGGFAFAPDVRLAPLRKDLVALERDLFTGHAQAIKVKPAARCMSCNDTLKPRQGMQFCMDHDDGVAFGGAGPLKTIDEEKIVGSCGASAAPPLLVKRCPPSPRWQPPSMASQPPLMVTCIGFGYVV